jgi:hypothetical protein
MAGYVQRRPGPPERRVYYSDEGVTLKLACLASVIVMLVAGCGSAAHTAGTLSQAPPSPLPPSQLQQLRAYLSAIEPILAADARATASLKTAEKSFNPNDTKTWPAFRKAVERAGSETTAFEISLTAIRPPASMKKAHALLLKAERMGYEWAVFVSEELRLGAPYEKWSSGWESRYLAGEEVRHEWHVAIGAEALRLGVSVPRSLRSVL